MSPSWRGGGLPKRVAVNQSKIIPDRKPHASKTVIQSRAVSPKKYMEALNSKILDVQIMNSSG